MAIPASHPFLRAGRPLACTLLALLAACGVPSALPARVAAPGVDPVSGQLASVETELPGADLAAVRGPAGAVLVGASLRAGQIFGGAQPECALRRLPSGAASPVGARCQSLLGAYAALERARTFLIVAGAESLTAPVVLAEPVADSAADLKAGLRYLPAVDAFALLPGPSGARVPSALNAGAVARESARRQLRGLLETHADEAEGVALFLGAAAASDPGYLAASEPGGDPAGETDLSRPLPAGAAAAQHLASAIWAWAEQTGDLTSASRAVLAAARALASSRPGDGGSGPGALLSLVAGQLDGAERDQACAVFRGRPSAAGGLSACP